MITVRLSACITIAMSIGIANAAAQPVQYASIPALKKLTLEELTQMPVISASRVEEPRWAAPYAIDVLTDEDIRRSGVVRLPEALRYVTGVEVMRYVSGSYAISSRGFASAAANKLEVRMDGRSLYTPLLSGVFWEIQDTMLEDLDRIEAVRGPGGSLWGANAVNGVINIVSKSARDTQGTLVMGGGGNEEQAFGGVRYGGTLATNSFYRVYVKQQFRDAQALQDGSDANDELRQTQIGFRTDTYFRESDQLTVQGDGLVNEFGVRNRDNAENSAGNLLARWSRKLSDEDEVRLQAYYDHAKRDVPLQFYEERNTFDVDAQHHFKWLDRNSIVWGLTYRGSWDETGFNGRTFRFDPDERDIHVGGVFLQDEITVVEDLFKVIPGVRLEHNTFTGVEVQPSGRFTITPGTRHTIWGAVSRAVRSPTRAEDDLRFSGSPTGAPLIVRGNRDFVSEELLAYEAGYRVKVAKRVTLDVAGFYNDYQNLRTQEPSATGIPLSLENEREGEIYGGELAVLVHLTDWARVRGSYSRMEQDLRFSSESRDPTGGSSEGNDPSDFATLNVAFDLPKGFEVDLFARYMDSLPEPYVSSYVMFDARIGWRMNDNVDISVVGQNLTDPRHREFGGRTFPQVERSIFAKATIRF